MQVNGVYFTEERNGYDKAQVDNYIRMLTQEYQVLQREFEALSQGAAYGAPRFSAGGAAREMNPWADAEETASHIISQAREEADQIVGRARQQVLQLQQDKQRAAQEISGIMHWLRMAIPAA